MRYLPVITFLAAIALAGCTSITGEFKVENSTSLTLDATKRIVVNAADPKDKSHRIVCAEPSPDAIASLAASVAGKLNTGQGPSGEASLSIAKSVASIGVRTAGIQILRDLGYRACEGVINKVINEKEYKILIAGSGPVAVALIAVEGLTQMSPAPLVAISSSGTAKTDSGTNAETKPASITISNTGTGYKPEELKNVAEQVYKIVKDVIDMSKEMMAQMK